MKILITGGAGFIASQVSDAYIEAGHDVVVVDNLCTGYESNINAKVVFYKIDIRDPKLEVIFEKEKPDIVSHHAAQVSVPYSIEDPIHDTYTNVVGFVNLLQCSIKHKVKKMIYISSGGAIYGEATEYPTSEEYPPKPLSIYAINKKLGEDYLYFYNQLYGIDYTVLRYANVYGPRQVSHGEAGVVSIFVEKLLNGEIPTINIYEEKSGMIRDYVYVKDVVSANLLALNKGSCKSYNIGTCVETTTLSLFNEIISILSISVEPTFSAARKGDIRRSLLTNDRALRELGWKPSYSLHTGLIETIDFFKTRR